jgi:hypothetical protein
MSVNAAIDRAAMANPAEKIMQWTSASSGSHTGMSMARNLLKAGHHPIV